MVFVQPVGRVTTPTGASMKSGVPDAIGKNNKGTNKLTNESHSSGTSKK